MTDLKCDVCHLNDAIGVASTSIPMSVAYCRECATRGADPEIVFECWIESEGLSASKDAELGEMADQHVTFKDGRYMTYREWHTQRLSEGDHTKSLRDGAE